MGTFPLKISAAQALTRHPHFNASSSLPPSVSLFNSSSKSPLYKLSSKSGIQKASQAAELFPSVNPVVVVRGARFEDFWEVAQIHCSTFFTNYAFPINLMLRINRMIKLLTGFPVPKGCMKTCLVAVAGSSFENLLESENLKNGAFEWILYYSKRPVVGTLTLDTLADFLPRKGPLQQRRTGIAYVSNVTVRKIDRRKGIAKRLMVKAEVVAKKWGCRAIALHCEAENQDALQLYLGLGYKRIKVPEHALWPHQRTSSAIQFNLLMKLLTPNLTTT